MSSSGKDNILYIGEVAKLLDIPRDTLRFFEDRGIVVPRKEAGNHYRYYNDWDINFLIEYKRYRSYEFNLEEAKEILHKDSFTELEERMKKNQERIRQKMVYYQYLYKRATIYLSHLKSAEKRIGTYEWTTIPKIEYLPMRYNNQYLCRKDVSELLSVWLQHLPFVDPIFVVSEHGGENYECALSVRKDLAFDISLPKNHLVKTVKQSKAINTIIMAGGENTFSTKLLNSAYCFIEENGYSLAGPAVGYYLARVHEGDCYKRYLDVFIPVKKIK